MEMFSPSSTRMFVSSFPKRKTKLLPLCFREGIENAHSPTVTEAYFLGVEAMSTPFSAGQTTGWQSIRDVLLLLNHHNADEMFLKCEKGERINAKSPLELIRYLTNLNVHHNGHLEHYKNKLQSQRVSTAQKIISMELLSSNDASCSDGASQVRQPKCLSYFVQERKAWLLCLTLSIHMSKKASYMNTCISVHANDFPAQLYIA